ncbi:MAG: GNAT family N-acetyltransferase [Deltaproteobacteria bacterium]
MTSSVNMIDGKRVSLLWAGPERAADIAGLHAKMFYPPWDAKAVHGLLDHPASTAFVATLAVPSEVIGFIIGHIAADESEILTFGVDPAHRKHGVGKLLAEGLLRAVGRAEVRRVFLEVATDNSAALHLYSKLGFVPAGVRKAYYTRPGSAPVDAVTMARTLTA